MPEGKFNQENSTQEPEIEILSSQAETFDEAGDASGMKETEGQASPAISAEVEEWKNKHDEMKEKMMWVAADFDNFKKRTLKEKEDYLKFSQASLLKEILVVGDNLERALGTLVAADGEKGVAANLKQGLELTLKQFTSFLEKHGVAKIKALGEK
ncbi:MAG TPA: nucleotide exchange factor GrpE, partial [bacterium]